MAVVFQVKGTALNAFYSRQGKEPGIFKKSTDADPAPTSYGDASVFGGQAIDFSNASTYPKGLIYPGFRNFSMNQAWTIRMRIVPFWTGLPPATQALFTFARNVDIGGTYPQFYCYLRADGQIDIFCATNLDGGSGYFAATIPDTVSCTSGVAFEIQISWTGLTGGGANTVKYSRDGANALNVAAPSTAWNADNWKWISAFKLGYAPGVMGTDCTKFALNELLIFDTAEPQTYTARTAFDSSRTAYDALDNSDPGVANVRSGTVYTFGGDSKTGTAAIPTAANVRSGTATDATTGTLAVPSASDVRNGTAVDNTTGTLVVPSLANTKIGVAGDGGTGTYDGSDRHTDPGVANVRSGTAYKSNSTSNNRTGTAAIPSAADVRSGTATDATTGTLAVPSASDVRDGVAVDNTTGTLVSVRNEISSAILVC